MSPGFDPSARIAWLENQNQMLFNRGVQLCSEVQGLQREISVVSAEKAEQESSKECTTGKLESE